MATIPIAICQALWKEATEQAKGLGIPLEFLNERGTLLRGDIFHAERRDVMTTVIAADSWAA